MARGLHVLLRHNLGPEWLGTLMCQATAARMKPGSPEEDCPPPRLVGIDGGLEEGSNMRSVRKRNWFLRRIVLGFAVAALVSPAAAQARLDEGGVAGASKSTELRMAPSPSAAGAIEAHQLQVGNLENDELISREGSSAWPGLDPTSGQSYPRWSSSTEVVTGNGFDWNDAGAGAGIALGLVLLGGVAFRVTSRLGKAQTA
jgi:hypothetical protein